MNRTTFGALMCELKPLWHTFRKGRLTYNLEQCLYITLWELGNSGVTFRQLSARFNVAKGTVHKIFYKTVKTICHLRKEITWPSVLQQKSLMERFQNSRETPFPFVIGCLDGTHLKIPKPKIDPISYYNRKGYFSINMQQSDYMSPSVEIEEEDNFQNNESATDENEDGITMRNYLTTLFSS